MGALTAAFLATSVIQGAGEVAGGIYAEKASRGAAELAEVNAARLKQQAGTIEIYKSLQAAADDRAMRFAMGATVATTVGKGLEMSGSPAAVMIDTLTQMEMDKAIGQYNLDIDKRRLETASEMTKIEARGIRQTGKAAKYAGYARGATTVAKGLLSAALSMKQPASKSANVIMKRGDAPTKINIAPAGYWRTRTSP